MTIAIVDDNQTELELLKHMLLCALGEMDTTVGEIHCFTDPEQFLIDFRSDRYDIVLLDIYMGALTGIHVARSIRQADKGITLAFCTSSNEFAAESYEVEAKYYLQKPITKEKLSAMLRRFDLNKMEHNRSICLPDGFRIPLRHLIYEEYRNHRVQFHLVGHPPRTLRMNQGEAEALLLPHKGFQIINKGCIVNFAQVKSIEGSSFLMKNDSLVPIARRRFKEVEAAYMEYLFQKMDEEVSD